MSEPSPIPSESGQSPESSSTPATGPPPTQQGRPRREGNDSLWKRARRTLGTNSLTFLQPQSRPPPGKTEIMSHDHRCSYQIRHDSVMNCHPPSKTPLSQCLNQPDYANMSGTSSP